MILANLFQIIKYKFFPFDYNTKTGLMIGGIGMKTYKVFFIFGLLSILITGCSPILVKEEPYRLVPNEVSTSQIKTRSVGENLAVEKELAINERLKETIEILNMNKADVYEKFGEPKLIDYFQVEYFKYKDKIIFFSHEKVSSIWWTKLDDLFGIEGEVTIEKVESVFGPAYWEGYLDSEIIIGHCLSYGIGNLQINFANLDTENAFVTVNYK